MTEQPVEKSAKEIELDEAERVSRERMAEVRRLAAAESGPEIASALAEIERETQRELEQDRRINRGENPAIYG